MAKHYNTKMKERWATYHDWFYKKVEQGVNMSPKSKRYADSYDVFKQRYESVVEEHRRTGSRETAMDSIRERSYAGGTRTQIKMYYDSVQEGMINLRATKPEVFKQLCDDMGFDINDISIQKILKEQHGGDGRWLNPEFGLKNADEDEEPGLLQVLYYKLKDNNIKINFSSPE